MFLCVGKYCLFFFFFFNDTATTEIYTLSLHDALPISRPIVPPNFCGGAGIWSPGIVVVALGERSEEHTSELQSRPHLVCRLLLEKKKKEEDKNNKPKKRKRDRKET